jgi:hypothetical protein
MQSPLALIPLSYHPDTNKALAPFDMRGHVGTGCKQCCEQVLLRTRFMKQAMETLGGLWIDHREVGILILSEKGEETRRVKSHVEKQLRRSGRSPPQATFEAQMMPADDSLEREYSGHLANYYDEVISCLRPAKAILLFGPGEAKGELRRRIERNKLDVHITKCETSDKMTERQISQKVRQHYLPSGAILPTGRRSKR